MADDGTRCRDIVVVGSSAGGIPVLIELVAALPADFSASILIVQHIGRHRSVLPQLLGKSGRLPVEHARADQPLQTGRVYVAPPDHHMLLDGNRIRLTQDAKENHARPAIDPLFCSAAIGY